MTARKMPRSRSRIFHVPKGVAYFVGNSPFGIRLAAALGFRWLDLDVNITRDGVLVVAHWPKIRKDKAVLPGWFVEKYGRNPRISDVLWVDLAELRTRRLRFRGRRSYRYHSLGYMLKLVARTKRLGAAIEVKGDPRFHDDETWEQVERSRRNAGLPASRFMAMTLQNIGNPWPRLRAAKRVAAGRWPVVLLARGPIPKERAEDFDYVRGRMRWV